MRALITATLATVLSMGALVAGGQVLTNNRNVSQEKTNDEQTQKNVQEPKAGDGKLKKRDIQLMITPVEYSDTVFEDVPTESYKVGDMVKIKIEMTNLMPIETEVILGDYYSQNRFRLTKDGTPVLYRSDVQKIVKKGDEATVIVGSRMPVVLQPNVPVVVMTMPLNLWYGPLEPGHYEITMRHRFWKKEQPVDSNTATFEVKL